MGKFVPNRGRLFRTKDDIASDYLNALIEKDVIKENDRKYYESTEGQTELLGILVDKLYETEEHQGVRISSLDAWYHWCKFIISKDPATDRYVWNRFVKDMFIDIEQHRYISILASRGLGKSFILYALYPSFKTWLYPMTEFVVVSNVPRQCKRNMRVLKRLIDTNEFLLDKKDSHKGKELVWTQDQIEYNEGFIETISVGTTPRSAHVNYAILDDALRDDGQYSDEEYVNFIDGQLLPIVQRKKGRIIVAGTPMHSGDLYHVLMNTLPDGEGDVIRDGSFSQKGYFSKAYPIITDWDKEEIYLPELFSWEDLVSGKQSILRVQGERQFQREYMLICSDKSTAIFSKELIDKCVTYEYKYLFSPDYADQLFVMGVDVATSGAASADFSAFIVLEVIDTEKGAKKVIRHVIHEKGMDISAEKDAEGELLSEGQIETVAELSERFNHAFTVVEKNNVGVALIQELQKMNVNVDEFVTSKQSKVNMIRYLVSEMQNGNLLIPHSEEENITKLKRELSNFGVHVSAKTKAETMRALTGHDDMVIALAIANHAASNMSSLPYAVLSDKTNR